MRKLKLGQCLVYSFVAFLLLNMVIFNMCIYYAYTLLRTTLTDLQSGRTWWEKLAEYPQIRDLILNAKEGGLIAIEQNTLERLFIMTHNVPKSSTRIKKYTKDQSNNIERYDTISFLGLDVSNAGEASYVYKRIISRKTFPYAKLVVDIGANDGLLSSNSFNFIQWGWDAVLVEPVEQQLELAKTNTKRYVDPYTDGKQLVRFIKAIIGTKDGYVDLALTSDPVSMENYVLTAGETLHRNFDGITLVKSMTVKTFIEDYNIPREFGVLSIDAEGLGDKILHQFMDLKVQPAYIIYESMHNAEHIESTVEYMAAFNYEYIGFLGWNHIYEYRGKMSNNAEL
ncbi:unnamed protein product [Owenia fusiformis]|uniref:Uncharacterized protein n=1 Tax=Owenia fusiformis TaxID=6347 RepID=A0A8J1XLR1_OWEFU|nr:unnamed protein product [Owenia fusiformis]